MRDPGLSALGDLEEAFRSSREEGAGVSTHRRTWQKWEAFVARVFRGRRRGPLTRGARGGTNDVIAPGWSIEVKLLARPTFQELLEACQQAEAAAGRDEQPVAVVRRKGDPKWDALVVYRLETFRDWHLGISS